MFPLPVALALLRSAYSSKILRAHHGGSPLSALPLLVVLYRRIVETRAAP